MRISDWSSDVCSSDLEDGQLLLDRADHAVAVRAVARGDVAAAAVGRGIDVVPFRGGLEARRVLVAQGVGPGGDAGQGRVLLAGQQARDLGVGGRGEVRSEEHTSELQSLMRISYAVFCLKKKQTSSDIHDDN